MNPKVHANFAQAWTRRVLLRKRTERIEMKTYKCLKAIQGTTHAIQFPTHGMPEGVSCLQIRENMKAKAKNLGFVLSPAKC